MSNLPKGEFNMPPGVSSRDIPGNGPETVICPKCQNEIDLDDVDIDNPKCPNCNASIDEIL